MLLPISLPRLPTAVWRSLHRTTPRGSHPPVHTRSTAGIAGSTQPGSLETLPHYAAYPLDRAATLRTDTTRLQQLLLDPTSRLLLYQGGRPLLQPSRSPAVDPQGAPAAWQPVTIVPASRALPHVQYKQDLTVFLGMDEEGAVFAAEVPDDADLATITDTLGLAQDTLVGNLRQHGPRMTPADAALAATAGGLLLWHRRTKHDPASGAPLEPTQGGHARAPPAPQARAVYPRLDPAVIALVTCGDWALLGRKAAWEPRRYSCLAGFCEVGETLEQAVVREVAEEAGVVVDHRQVAYHSSQPWPFPSSLMIGFVATIPPKHTTARSGMQWLGPQGAEAAQAVGVTAAEVDAAHSGAWLPVVNADEDELQDARWFHRDALRDVVNGQTAAFRIPQQYALANRIVCSWLQDTRGPLDAIPAVRIDEGVFKYILARVRHVETGACALVVRGDVRAGYHDHLLGHLRAEAAHLGGIEVEVCGGGRIEHHAAQQVVQVYGYSSAFGAAPHEVTAALLKRALPLYASDSITTSYEGY